MNPDTLRVLVVSVWKFSIPIFHVVVTPATPLSSHDANHEESEFVENLRIVYPLISPSSQGVPYRDFMAGLYKCEVCDLVMLARRREVHDCIKRG